MSEHQPQPSDRSALLEELVRHGHLIPSGEHGLYGRGDLCDIVYNGVNAILTSFALDDKPEILRFPPLVPRRLLDEVGYTRSFPHLCGVVVGISPDERQLAVAESKLKDSRSLDFQHTRLALLPAACYPAYPAIARRGRLPSAGATLDLGAACVYRNEPSDDPTRLQVFHQREFVRLGDEPQVLRWRERWMERAAAIYETLDLEATFAVATDQFFGRGGRLLARNQSDDQLKYEALVCIARGSATAVSSFNYHRDHLGKTFAITRAGGGVARTACVGFGLERIAIALFARHGCDVRDWPAKVRRLFNL